MRAWRRHAFPSLAAVTGTIVSTPVEDESARQLTEDVLDEYRRAGFDEGCAQGRQEGAVEAREQARRATRSALDELSGPVDHLVRGIERLQQELTARTQTQLVGLVEQVARQVIRAELEMRPERLLAFVEEAMAGQPQTESKAHVRLHPDEYARVSAAAPELAARWALIPDNSLDRGECRVSAGGRELDAGCGQRLAVCLEQIRELLAPEATDGAS